jgi:hypothetical protein
MLQFSYKYKVRQTGAAMEIQITEGADRTSFVDDLFSAVSSLNPTIIKETTIEMNDELRILVKTDIGVFEIMKDTWGFAFLMDKGKFVVPEILKILETNKMFALA